MESLNYFQIIAFSLVAYILGYSAGRKSGFIEAIRSIPITILEFSDELQLRRVKNETDIPSKKR